MSDDDWNDPGCHQMAMLLDGAHIGEKGPRGETITDDRILLLIDAGDGQVEWKLPPTDGAWRPEFCSAPDVGGADGGTYVTPGRAVVVFVESFEAE